MSYPQFTPVADHALLVSLADSFDPAVNARIGALDQAIASAALPGVIETVPAFVNLLVSFDPLLTDHAALTDAVQALLDNDGQAPRPGQERRVQVCYDEPFAPDLAAVAAATGLAPADVIAAHLSGDYNVVMYGFAPGYAYLGGVPEAIRVPRKPSPVRDVPAGSVLIAGNQCLVSTLTMPTGWSIIGRSPTPILRDDPARPFLFDVGDRVVFEQVNAAALDNVEMAVAEAVLNVSFAGPLVTVQDGGRPGNMRYGVPASGPMDRLSHAAANAALGNPHDAAAIEISLGGLMATCAAGPITVAVAGGDFAVEHNGQKLPGWSVLTLQKGDRLAIRAGKAGSWAYLAFAGTLQRPAWLGHLATHAISGFGGGAVRGGDALQLADAMAHPSREGDIPRPPAPVAPDRVRIVLGPQDRHFEPQALEALQSTPYALTEQYDRMGVRLSGAPLPLKGALSIPSEPIVRGALQVSGDGVPTLLLADHQTTGGYPKIATVISADLDQITQMRHRDTLRFQPVTPQEAVVAARSRARADAAYLAAVAVPRGTMAERLMRENLISGVVSSREPG